MQLRDYQIDLATKACALLQTSGIAYLSLEVRTGKTLTALHAADLYGCKFVLFVTKKKAILSIEGDWLALKPGYMLVTTNYEALHTLEARYPGVTYDLVILDEAHCLGQYPKPSERTKQLKELCKGKPIIYLSGSPTPESYSQLFHQFYVSSFSPFGDINFYKWAVEYVTIKKKYVSAGNAVNDYSHADKDKIDRYTAHLFLSYTQEQAGFQQEVQEEVMTVEMRGATYWLADKIKKDRVFIGKGGEEIIADTEVKLMNKLHQIYSGTVIDEDKNGKVFDDTKARFIQEQFRGQRTAIFYKFTAELLMLKKVFGYCITESPEEFNNSHDKVFVSQIQSGREGINLSTADALVMLNIDFAAVSYWQARARMQSKDRVKPAKLYWIFSKGGIEQRIYDAVMNKRDYTVSYFKKDYHITPSKRAA